MLEVCTFCNALVEPDDYIVQVRTDIVVCRHCSPEFVGEVLTRIGHSSTVPKSPEADHDQASCDEELPF